MTCKTCHREQVLLRVYGDEFLFCPICETDEDAQLELPSDKKDENDEEA